MADDPERRAALRAAIERFPILAGPTTKRKEYLEVEIPRLLAKLSPAQQDQFMQSFDKFFKSVDSAVDTDRLRKIIMMIAGGYANHLLDITEPNMVLPEHEDLEAYAEKLLKSGLTNKVLREIHLAVMDPTNKARMSAVLALHPSARMLVRWMQGKAFIPTRITRGKLTADAKVETRDDLDDVYAGLVAPSVPLNATLDAKYMLRKKIAFFEALAKAKVEVDGVEVVYSRPEAMTLANLIWDYVDVVGTYQARDIVNVFNKPDPQDHELAQLANDRAEECAAEGCEVLQELWESFTVNLATHSHKNKAYNEFQYPLTAILHRDCVYAVATAVMESDITVWNMITKYKIDHKRIPEDAFSLIRVIINAGLNGAMSEDDVERTLQVVLLYDKIDNVSDALHLFQPPGTHVKFMSHDIVKIKGAFQVFKEQCGRIINTIDIIGEKVFHQMKTREPGAPLQLKKFNATGKVSKSKEYHSLEELQLEVIKAYKKPSERKDPCVVAEFTDGEEEDEEAGSDEDDEEEGEENQDAKDAEDVEMEGN